MEKSFQIFTDSCADLSTAVRKKYDISYLFMGLVVDGVEKHADLDWVEYKPEEFYGWLSSGKKVKTTQVSLPEIETKFKPVLDKGLDILYIACSSALSGSGNFASVLSKEILENYPDRRIIVIDSLAGSMTEGLQVVEAAKLQQAGKSLDEVAKYVEENKFFYNQFATVDTLSYLKEAGRIKGTAAFFGNIIGVKPIFISDTKGNNFVIEKVRGTKASLDALFNGVKETYMKEKCEKVFIGQGMAMDRAVQLQKRIMDELKIEAVIDWIGPIVGTTCGPGVISVFTIGKEVTRFDGDGIK